MAGVLAALDGEFVVRRARLPRVTPSPSWNGVLGSGGGAHAPLISVLSECGRVYLLRLTTAIGAFEFEDALTVAQVLESESAAVMSMCHAWTRRGDVLVVARDRQLTIYRRRSETTETATQEEEAPAPFQVASSAALRFPATSLDVMEDETGGLLLVVGCAGGVMVLTASADGTGVSGGGSILEDVAVAITTFSPSGEFLGVGTIDGRVMILRRTGATFSSLDSAQSFSKVLAAPRVTSATFSPSSNRLVTTTRKGNVYVFSRDAQLRQWALDETFASLVANPKGGATSQTLSCWWGPAPIFALAGRAASSTLELYDVHSCSRLHTLQLRGKGLADTSITPSQESADRHLMGVVSVPSASSPRLVCIDSDACLTLITWPFLEFACPQ